MSVPDKVHQPIAEEIHRLALGFQKASRELLEIRNRTERLSAEIEELKKWAATLPKP